MVYEGTDSRWALNVWGAEQQRSELRVRDWQHGMDTHRGWDLGALYFFHVPFNVERTLYERATKQCLIEGEMAAEGRKEDDNSVRGVVDARGTCVYWDQPLLGHRTIHPLPVLMANINKHKRPWLDSGSLCDAWRAKNPIDASFQKHCLHVLKYLDYALMLPGRNGSVAAVDSLRR